MKAVQDRFSLLREAREKALKKNIETIKLFENKQLKLGSFLTKNEIIYGLDLCETHIERAFNGRDRIQITERNFKAAADRGVDMGLFVIRLFLSARAIPTLVYRSLLGRRIDALDRAQLRAPDTATFVKWRGERCPSIPPPWDFPEDNFNRHAWEVFIHDTTDEAWEVFFKQLKK